jgi:hypothetical protein
VKPGDIVPITIEALIVSNADVNKTVFNISIDFNLLVVVSDLVVISNVSSYYVPFQDDLVINASASYDPDFTTNLSNPNTTVIAY